MPGSPPETRTAQLTYSESGVDIAAGQEAVRRMRRHVESTRVPGQISDLGGFAGLMSLPKGLVDPVLVSCTDGVGSKVLIAIAMNKHDTVGIDAVAMNVNDLLVTGARPLFVLDYIGISKVDPAVVADLVAGIAEGCRQSSCALLGGETAELPDLYEVGHYDLAAFAVGIVEHASVVTAERVREGDVVLGLPSSGLHSNGYTLARRALLDPAGAGLGLDDPLPGAPELSVGRALLEPTLIYEPAFAALRDRDGAPLHGAAHITGGGLIENPARTIPDDLAVDIDISGVPLPAIVQAIADSGVATDELHRTFNCGIGMLLYVDAEHSSEVRGALDAAGQPSLELGRIVRRPDDGPQVRLAH